MNIWRIKLSILPIFILLVFSGCKSGQYENISSCTEEIDKQNCLYDNLAISYLRNCELLDENGMKSNISEIIDNSGCKLVLVLSKGLCTPCFTEYLTLFKESKKYVNEKDIILITPFDNLRELNVYKKSENLTCMSYIFADSISDKIQHPTYYLINNLLEFENAYKIEYYDSIKTINYFILINSKIINCL